MEIVVQFINFRNRFNNNYIYWWWWWRGKVLIMLYLVVQVEVDGNYWNLVVQETLQVHLQVKVIMVVMA
jgi:hypothetical protein